MITKSCPKKMKFMVDKPEDEVTNDRLVAMMKKLKQIWRQAQAEFRILW